MAETVHALFVFVRLHARGGGEAEVAGALSSVVAASRGEPGCVRMNAFQSVRDSRLFFIQSVWRDEAAFEVHASLAHTLTFIETVDRLLDQPREVIRTIEIA